MLVHFVATFPPDNPWGDAGLPRLLSAAMSRSREFNHRHIRGVMEHFERERGIIQWHSW